MLAKRFEHILHDLGMAGLEHPLFYHAPVGIRFKIGGEEPIYLDRRAAKLKTNPAYVQGALDRAAAIYRALPAVPDLLRIDGYPDEEPAESLLTVIRQRVGLPVPDEQLSATEQDEDGDNPIQDGETIDGVADGQMCREIQWKCQYEDALIQPPRGVLDINMGNYASGGR